MAARKDIERAIRVFEQAVIERSWKGSKPPEEHYKIELRYEYAKLMLRLAAGATSLNPAKMKQIKELRKEIDNAI